MSADEYTYLPLFAYGTLMSGQPAFHLVAASVIRSTRAVAHGFIMYDAGAYPVATHGDGVIMGEVLWLRKVGYVSLLDALAAYEGPAYRRERCRVRLEDTTEVIEAWIFLGNAELGLRLPPVAGGDWQRWLQSQRRS